VPRLKQFSREFFLPGKCPWERARDERVTPATLATKRGHLENHIWPAFGDYRLNKITPLALREWLLELDYAAHTRREILASLRAIFDEALIHEHVSTNPAANIKGIRGDAEETDIFTPAEYAELFGEQRLAYWGSQLHVALFSLMRVTGLRLGEALGIQWRDVYFEERGVTITRSVKDYSEPGKPKTRKSRRVVPLYEPALSELRTWYENTNYRERESYVFRGSRGKPITRHTAFKAFLRALERAGIERGERVLTTRSFRHTLNTRLRRRLEPEALRAALGHSTEKMSDYYDHPEVVESLRYLHQYQDVFRSAIEGES
jgi:integrase